MKQFLLVLMLGLPFGSFGMDRLAALSMLESGNNDRAIGKAGEVSRFQVMRREWRSVTNSTAYTDSGTARAVVLAIMDRRIRQFEAAHGRLPTDFEYYGLWNAPSQVLRGRVSRVVAERCRRFENLCNREQQIAQTSNRPVF